MTKRHLPSQSRTPPGMTTILSRNIRPTPVPHTRNEKHETKKSKIQTEASPVQSTSESRVQQLFPTGPCFPKRNVNSKTFINLDTRLTYKFYARLFKLFQPQTSETSLSDVINHQWQPAGSDCSQSACQLAPRTDGRTDGASFVCTSHAYCTFRNGLTNLVPSRTNVFLHCLWPCRKSKSWHGWLEFKNKIRGRHFRMYCWCVATPNFLFGFK